MGQIGAVEGWPWMTETRRLSVQRSCHVVVSLGRGTPQSSCFFVYVRFIAEPIGSIRQMGEIALVVLTIFLECDFRTNLQTWWKEMRNVRNVHQGLRDKCWHWCHWDGQWCTIILENKVMRGWVGVEGYIHYHSRVGLTCGGVHIGHLSAWGKRLANRHHLFPMERD